VAAVDGEAKRSAIFWIAPFGSHFLHELIRAGILIAVMCSLWFGVMGRAARSAAWTSGLGLALLLSFWALEPLLWWGGYPQMLRILGDGHGLWWLHAGALLMLPLALLFFRLAGEMPERTGRFSGEQLRVMLFAASLVVVMLVLRREIFAITHAPPLAGTKCSRVRAA